MPVHLKKGRCVSQTTQGVSGDGNQDRLDNRILNRNGQPRQTASTPKPGPSRIIDLPQVTPIDFHTPSAVLPILPKQATDSLDNESGQMNIPIKSKMRKSSSTGTLNGCQDSLQSSDRFRTVHKSAESFAVSAMPTSACSSTKNASISASFEPIGPVERNGFWNVTYRKSYHSGTNNEGLNITVPYKDTETQVQMAKYISQFMDRHGQECEIKPDSWKYFMSPSRIPTHMFMGMVKFVATFFVGEGFFVKGKDEEKTLEVAELLKYPGKLLKSNLVTPTAQHSWPAHLKFLAWLCCRAQAMLEPEDLVEDTSKVCDQKKVFKDLRFKSLVNIFQHSWTDRVLDMHEEGRVSVDEEILENEIREYRRRVRGFFCPYIHIPYTNELCVIIRLIVSYFFLPMLNRLFSDEMLSPGVNDTKDALVQKRNKEMKKLERLNKEPNPTLELQNRLENVQQSLASIRHKIQEAEAKYKRYSDDGHLLIEMKDLETLASQKWKELKVVQEKVKSQKLSHETAAKVLEESKAIKKQLKSIGTVTAQLKLQVEKETQKLENCERMFYKVVSKYSILDEYNVLVRSLQLEDLLIPPNPFSQKEFLEWLKVATSKLQKATRTLEDMMSKAASESEETKIEKEKDEQQMENLRRKIENYQTKLETQSDELSFLSNELDSQYKAELEKLTMLQVEVKTNEIELQKAEKLTTIWSESLEEWKERLQQFKNGEVLQRNKLDQEYANLKLEESELQESMIGYTLYAVQRHTAFYDDVAQLLGTEEGAGHDDTTVSVEENEND
ncbi:unnamed protein product [Orchesella dallaii]|uniref:Kinetochore protein NDC80 n=1 Tax=Orchesella dallaii TaxID=48710 RepID=A0ABP1PW21_9HEXA